MAINLFQAQGMSQRPQSGTYQELMANQQKPVINKPTAPVSSGFNITQNNNTNTGKITLKEFGDKLKIKYPQYKDIDSIELGNKMLSKYPQYKDSIIEDKGPDGFTGAVMGTVEGVISQAPAFAANLGGAFNKYVTAPASAVLGENLFGVPREQNPLYKGAMRLSGETPKTGEQLKQSIKKFGVAKDNTISQKVGEEITNIGGSVLIPGGVMQKGVPLGQQLTRGAIQGVAETMKYTAGARGELPTGTEAVIGAVLPPALGVVGNKLGGIKNKLMTSGLMTPAKLTQAKQRIITEVGEEAGKELDNVIKTPDDVSKWLLDRGIKGDKEEIIQQLIKNAENSKQMVDNQLASVNEYIAASAPEMDNTRKALDVLFDAYKDDIGNQGIFNKITSYIGKLQEKGGGLTVSEMNDIKRLIDRSELNPYTLVGKVRAGKSGLNNIRNGLKQDIENIAERNGVEGIKMLNNNTSVSRFMADAIGKKNDSEMARELVSVFAPRLVGGAIGGTTGGPFNEKTTEGKIGNFLFGAFVGGALGSTKFKTNLANFINKLTPSEKGVIQQFINSRGQSNIPKDIYNKLSKFREGNKIIPKETTNVSNINNNLTNNIQLKPSILSTREKALLKPNSTTNVSNKPNIEPKKTGRELLKKVLPSNFKEKAQDFVEGVAEKVGAKKNLLPRTEKQVFVSDDLVNEANKYKSFEEFKKSQDKVYHGGAGIDKLKKNFNIITPDEKLKYPSSGGGNIGLSTTSNKEYAKQYSQNIGNRNDVLEVFINPKAKIYDLGDTHIDDLSQAELIKLSKKYDIIKSNQENEFRILTNNGVKTEAQLKQIYEQSKALPRTKVGDELVKSRTEKQVSIDKTKLLKPSDKVMKSDELYAVHGIREDNLKKVIDLGGFPGPSIAVVKKDNIYRDFGDIQVIFNKNAINPKNPKNKLYSADIYSPRVKVGDKGIEVKQPFSVLNPQEQRAIQIYERTTGGKFKDFEDKKDLVDNLDSSFEVYDYMNKIGIEDTGKFLDDIGEKIFKTEKPNLDNIVKKMFAKGSVGQEDFGMTLGKIKGYLAKQYKNIDDIDRSKIVSREEGEKLYNKAYDLYGDLMEEYGISKLDTFMQDIGPKIKSDANIKKYAKENYINIGKDGVKKIQDFFKYVDELPVSYMEAKPERGIKFDEVEKIFVPKDRFADIDNYFKKSGIDIKGKLEPYTDVIDRQVKIKGLSEKYGNIFFSIGGVVIPAAYIYQLLQQKKESI